MKTKMSEPKNSIIRVDHQPLVLPLNLWLQWYGDGTPEDDGEICESEVTWSREKIFDHDVEYVHADEIRRALMGHRRSELWGDKGLIAATMRCVDALGMIEDLVTTDHETKEAFIQRVRGILGHNETSPSVGAKEMKS
jgi:hypothetical protein